MTATQVNVPDIGDMSDVEVIEILVKPGDTIAVDQSLITVESDKASMEIPSSHAGIVKELLVKIGDRVSEGAAVLTLVGEQAETAPAATPVAVAPAPAPSASVAEPSAPQQAAGAGAHGADAFSSLAPWPQVDFARFGEVEYVELSRIQKTSGAALHRNWIRIPHVTNHTDADVTDLEAFRKEVNREQGEQGVKMTMLALLVKACVVTLRHFPKFNASLDGERLVLKKYFHIGIAVDTPRGLVVPVIRDADRKGLVDIAQEAATLAVRARDGALTPADMAGGTFSISSLGGIGGSYFTPIINAPEVAILGVGRASERVVWKDGQAAPQQLLPLSLSWDHRVIDGAAAARFNAHLTAVLEDFRNAAL